MYIQQGGDGVLVQGILQSDMAEFATGEHGLHVHAKGEISPDCGASGGHFKSTDDQIHGYPEKEMPDRWES